MYFVIGANGYLGSYFIKNILSYFDDKIVATARKLQDLPDYGPRVTWVQMDVTNDSEVDDFCDGCLKHGEDIKVIYLAAYHHPDEVEKNFSYAWDVNVTALSKFVNKIHGVKCFFYPSTEMVYGDAGKERIKESAKLAPPNSYGKQKIVAEAIVCGHGYNVVRFPVLIGPSILCHKKHFYDVIVETITQGKHIEMFSDAYRCMLDFDTATYLVLQLIEKHTTKMPQIVNVAGDEPLSKYDIGCRIADKLGVSRDLVVPISLATPNGVFEVKRTLSTLMDNSLLKELLGLDTISMKY